MRVPQPWHCPPSTDRHAVALAYAKELMPKYGLPGFWTGTYDPKRFHAPHPEKVEKDLRWIMLQGSKLLHGNHYERRNHVGLQYIAGLEPQKSGRLHAHAVIGDPDVDIMAATVEMSQFRGALCAIADDRCGFAKLLAPRNQADVDSYVSKYVVKGGEIILSDRLEHMNAGQLSLAPGAGGLLWGGRGADLGQCSIAATVTSQ